MSPRLVIFVQIKNLNFKKSNLCINGFCVFYYKNGNKLLLVGRYRVGSVDTHFCSLVICIGLERNIKNEICRCGKSQLVGGLVEIFDILNFVASSA